MNSRQVAVLGSGPSGLLAAWACVDAGFEPVLFDKDIQQPNGTTAGVFYLHGKCNLPIRSAKVDILAVGANARDLQYAYREKVYKSHDKNLMVSIPSSREIHTVYDGMQAMAFLWGVFGPKIEHGYIETFDEALDFLHAYPRVISTIPLPVYFPNTSFPYKIAWIKTASYPYIVDDENYVLYNANPSVEWYRMSNIFGRWTMEYVPGYIPYAEENRHPYMCREVQKVEPALRGTIPETPDNFLLTGRYGAWDKSCLTNLVYERVIKWLCLDR